MNNKIFRKLRGKKEEIKNFDLENLVTVGKENDLTSSEYKPTREEISSLTSMYEVTIEEAKRAIQLLGYENAIQYTEFFFNTDLDKKLYLEGAEALLKDEVDFEQLNKSTLDYEAQSYVNKYNISLKKLMQKEYTIIDPETKKQVSRESPYDSEHTVEHLDSRLDRLEEE